MKKIIFCVNLCLCFLFVCCKSNVKSDDIGAVTDLNLDSYAFSDNLSDVVDSISFVPLRATEDDALFKMINKCVVSDSCMVLLDYFGSSVATVWNLDGTFICKVGRQGQGPGEYNRITDIDVANGHIYMLDASRRTVFCYDMDGKYRQSFSYNGKLEGVNDLIVTNDSCFLLGMDVELDQERQVILADKDFNVKEVLLHFDEDVTRGHLNIGSFRRCGENIVYYYPVSDKLYVFSTDGKLNQAYNISMGKDIPLDIRKDYYKLSEVRKDRELTYFFETPFFNGNILLSTIYYESKKAAFCAYIQSHSYMRQVYDERNPSLSLSDFNFPIYLDDKRVICSLDPSLVDFLDKESKHLLGDDLLAFLEEGELLLVVYHLK